MWDDEFDNTGRIAARLGVLFYALAFIVPRLGDGPPGETGRFFGSRLFFLGLFYCWAFPVTFGWWANVLIAIAFFSRPAAAQFCSIAAVLIAASTLIFQFWGFGLPYFFWIGGMIFYAIGSCQRAAERS